MHSNGGELGGDLKTDTVTIIGGALDLQEKVSYRCLDGRRSYSSPHHHRS